MNGLLRVARSRRHGSIRAKAAIVGGGEIAITAAPWQVAVLAEGTVDGEEFSSLCGGAIINPTPTSINADNIVTAAHCVYKPDTSEVIPPEDFVVVAGDSDLTIHEAEAQPADVRAVRVHPYYTPDSGGTSANADDVAVIELAKPLTSTPAVKPIALANAGTIVNEGAPLGLTGFGDQSWEPEELNGKLYSIKTTAAFARVCGGEANALYVCTSTPNGSLCFGDSGSGLTLPEVTPTLIGVADTVEVLEGAPCRPGAWNGFVNLAAPEIRDFIEGSASPPRAPRGGGAIIRGIPEVGYSFSCEPGSWTHSPTYTYAFVNSATSQVLQEGPSSTYVLTSAVVGDGILCEVRASNAGGTGVGRTPPLSPIQAAPGSGTGNVITQPSPKATPTEASNLRASEPVAKSAVRAMSRKLSISGSNVVVDLDCTGAAACSGKLTLTAKRTTTVKGRKRVTVVDIGTADFSISGGGQAKIKIKLSPFGRAQVRATHGHLPAVLETLGYETEPTHKRSQDVTIL